MKARFRGLRFVALMSKGLGWLCLIAALVLGVLIASGQRYFPLLPPGQPYSTNDLVGAVTIFFPLFVAFLFFFGAGGALQVLVAIERNTRAIAQQPSESAPGDMGQPADSELPEIP